MKRFQMDRPVMVKRWRREWINHGRNFGNCHCGLGIGTMRKHRPNESHSPNQHCSVCECERSEARQKRRKERYSGKRLARLIE